ncbi:putative phage abortive infection protein [Leuconostoc mesenteroides]|uniref:putative phage abortive infection protein n=1 Tax=Leuconostoc mesenteroides TaxID=1245 RepID=UPI0021A7EB84|nr:putative phage abortive infection protein [Leuconostoc mesenteroides]
MILSLIKEQKNLINDDVRNLCDSIAKKCQDELTLANISYMRLVKFIKEHKNEIEDISDRDIEIIVLVSWKNYFENLDKNLLNYNKIAKSNTNKLSKESTKKYTIMGRTIFENNIDAEFFILGTTKFPLKSLTNKVTYEEATKIINNVYHINYDKLGHFFKHFHRIIKLILEGTLSHDTREQRDLIGILRAQFSEKLLVLLYYNATYTSRGYGLGMLLQGSYFFGDSYDFNPDYSGNEYLEITHISSSKLYFPDLDSDILKNIYGKGNLIKIPKKNSTDKNIKKFLKSIKDLQQEK